MVLLHAARPTALDAGPTRSPLADGTRRWALAVLQRLLNDRCGALRVMMLMLPPASGALPLRWPLVLRLSSRCARAWSATGCSALASSLHHHSLTQHLCCFLFSSRSKAFVRSHPRLKGKDETFLRQIDDTVVRCAIISFRLVRAGRSLSHGLAWHC